jgi:hypothetical protein
MKSSFPTVYVFTTSENHMSLVQNLIFVATQDNNQLDKEELEFMSYQNDASNMLNDTGYLENYRVSGMKTDDISILTDDFSPVESLINPVSSQPYFNEDSVFSENKSRAWFSENTGVKIGLLIAVGFTWLTFFRSTWNESPQQK